MNFSIVDAHTHFFSYNWFHQFYQLSKEKFTDGGVDAVAEFLGWELPSPDAHELGKRWVAEQKKVGLKRQVLFAGTTHDAEHLTAAVRVNPDRLIGYVMIDPTKPDARMRTHYALHILDLKGLLLFPAMHHFHVFDEMLIPIYEEAYSAGAPVFIHFGQLRIPVFQKLGLPDNIDLTYSNPIDLQSVAKEYESVNFIIPHFGGGRFDEALSVAVKNPNVYFDTSSSNSWIQPPLTLEDVFERTLDAIGARRILFGTDSSFFPRGWRSEIFRTQLEILIKLGVKEDEKAMIFGENIERLLGLK